MPALNEAMESAEQVGTTLSSLVPQLFFDLIARIIPGLVIIWSLYLALLDNELLNSKDVVDNISSLLPENDFFVFCIAIVIFYNSSVLFYGIWSAIFCIFRLQFLYKFLIKTTEEDLAEVIVSSESFSLRHDYIKLKKPIAGNRITKIQAEIHMSGALAATFLLCLLIIIVTYFSGSELERIELISRLLFFTLGVIGFFCSNLFFTARLDRSVKSYSKLLGFQNLSFSSPAPEASEAPPTSY